MIEHTPVPEQWRGLGVHRQVHAEIDTGNVMCSHSIRADQLIDPSREKVALREPNEAAERLARSFPGITRST